MMGGVSPVGVEEEWMEVHGESGASEQVQEELLRAEGVCSVLNIWVEE